MAKDDAPDNIPYGRLMHEAMRGLIQRVLRDVGRTGLPGENHFVITFKTTVDGVEIAPRLLDRYPEDMTIVIQHWFEDLQVGEDEFSITLNFGDTPERLVIPFDAILTFVDPSANFGFRFEPQDGNEVETDEDAEDETPSGDAEVVSLDAFRK